MKKAFTEKSTPDGALSEKVIKTLNIAPFLTLPGKRKGLCIFLLLNSYVISLRQVRKLLKIFLNFLNNCISCQAEYD